jgi:hypothetical protein
MHPVLASRICTPTGNCCQQKLQGGITWKYRVAGYVVPASVADGRRHENSALLLKNSLRCTSLAFRSERPRHLLFKKHDNNAKLCGFRLSEPRRTRGKKTPSNNAAFRPLFRGVRLLARIYTF